MPLLPPPPGVAVALVVVVDPPDAVPSMTPKMPLQAASAEAQAREASVT